jgi:hypothetical protein
LGYARPPPPTKTVSAGVDENKELESHPAIKAPPPPVLYLPPAPPPPHSCAWMAVVLGGTDTLEAPPSWEYTTTKGVVEVEQV